MPHIFISWSGENSKIIASRLKLALDEIFENERLSTFMSEKNIESGDEWFQTIKQQLVTCNFVIIILTKDNLSAPWIMFESGAIAIKHASKKVVPFLFGVKVDTKSPLSHYNHIKYSKEGFSKLINSIINFFHFKKSTETQLKNMIPTIYNEFNDNIFEIVEKMQNVDLYDVSHIYPNNVQSISQKSVFISAPMNSCESNDEYKTLRTHILKLKILLMKQGISEVIYPADTIETKEDFDGEVSVINSNFCKLKSVKCLIAIYPTPIPSSVLMEIGYALALSKNIIVFTKNRRALPFMLREANTLPFIQIHEYTDLEEIKTFIERNASTIFK